MNVKNQTQTTKTMVAPSRKTRIQGFVTLLVPMKGEALYYHSLENLAEG